jgi:hypothetical protein
MYMYQHAFWALIIGLLKSRELGPYFKNTKKILCFLLVSRIMDLYVRRIPDIKKVVLLYINVRTIRFYPIR